MQIKVNYKAIFIQGNDKNTVEYHELGQLEKGKLAFKDISINYNENRVILKHNQSALYFDFHKDMYNQYDVGYGKVNLTTRLLKFTANHHHMKMKYQLLDHNEVITTTYLLVEMIPYESA